MNPAIKPALLLGALAPGLLLGLGGCAATNVALEHKDLSVESRMSATVFFDSGSRKDKTVFLEVRNTSQRDLALAPLIMARLEQAGYRVLADPAAADFVLQVNVLHAGKTDPSAAQESLRGGWNAPLASGLAGAAFASSRSPNGSLRAAVIAGALELIVDSLVRNVTYSIVTDIQITERTGETVTQKVESDLPQGTDTRITLTSESTDHRKKYRTRIVATANQVNLKFEAALPSLEQQLARSIAGIF